MKTIDLRDLENVLGGMLDSRPPRVLPQERPLPLPRPTSPMPLGPYCPAPPSNVV